MKTLSRSAQKNMDAAAAAAGLPTLLLMEQAGTALARHIAAHYASGIALEVFCGKGNNGGDAYVAARLLAAEGFNPRVWELDCAAARAAQLAGTDAGRMRAALLAVGIEPQAVRGFAACYAERLARVERADEDPCAGEYGATARLPKQPNSLNDKVSVLLLDGLLGSGFRAARELDDTLAELCGQLNRLSAQADVRLIAIDIPSGVDADDGLCAAQALRAHETLSFVYPKTGCVTYPGRAHSGRLNFPHLGLNRGFLDAFWAHYSEIPVEWVDEAYAKALLPRRPQDGHKGSFGRALLIGGSRGMAGAIVLAARAAVQSGLGMTKALVEAELYAPCLNAAPAVLWEILPEEDAALAGALRSAWAAQNAVLVGPGLGHLDKARQRIILDVLRDCPMPLVLDADALNYLAANPEFMQAFFAARPASSVLTPHPGEFARLAPDLAGLSRLEQAAKLAERLTAAVVLKGAGSVVAAPEGRLRVNSSGNDGLAKAGSGDVLAGILTTFLAQGLAAEQAAALAVFAHGLAADWAAAESGNRSLTQEAVLAALPKVLRQLEERESDS